MISTLSPERRTVLGQLARFVVSGAFVTALGVGVYAFGGLVLRWHPQLGNFLAYVVGVAAGKDHNLALKADGTVVGWGEDSSGQATVPPGLSNVVSISAG